MGTGADHGAGFHHPQKARRRSHGGCLIVEIKALNHRVTTDQDIERDERGEQRHKRRPESGCDPAQWTGLNPDRLKYEILDV